MTETKTTTKTAPAKKAAAKKAPANKAAPKPAAKKAAAPAGAKLRWQVEGDDRNAKGGKNQTARVGDRVYAIKKAGEKNWTATVTRNGKAVILSDGRVDSSEMRAKR